MAKYNYASLDDVPKNVKDFYYNTSGACDDTSEPYSVDLLTVADLNEFLNDLDEWYESRQMNIEDFING